MTTNRPRRPPPIRREKLKLTFRERVARFLFGDVIDDAVRAAAIAERQDADKEEAQG